MNQEPEMNQEDLKLRARLREAVRSEETPPFLEARIRAQIQAEGQPRPRWTGGWAMAGAALMVLAGASVAYELGHLRFTAASQASYVSAVSRQVASIMRVGLGDHLHCAYFQKFPKERPKPEEFVRFMGPDYAGLIPIVRQHVPERYRLEHAHRCLHHGRKFVHLVLRGESKLLSVVVAKKSEGESFAIEGLLPALVQSGLPVYRASSKNFEVAGFESRDHLVYMISDLPGQANMDQLLAMAPAVRSYLTRLEQL